MENRSYAFFAGLFTITLCVATLLALFWFSGRTEETVQYAVLTNKSVTGLNVQAQVRFRGIRVGKVEFMEIDTQHPENTLIHIRIRKDIPITQATSASLGYQGVTGIAHIMLEDDGSDKRLLVGENGGLPVIPMADSLLQEITDLGKETLRQTRDFLGNANLLLNTKNRQSIENILQNTEAITLSVRHSTAQIEKFLSPDKIALLQKTLQNTSQAASQAAPFFAEARSLVARLNSTSEKLESLLDESKDAGAGQLVKRLNDLSQELNTSSQQLNRVLRTLEETPQSLIFGPATIPPGPGENGFKR